MSESIWEAPEIMLLPVIYPCHEPEMSESIWEAPDIIPLGNWDDSEISPLGKPINEFAIIVPLALIIEEVIELTTSSDLFIFVVCKKVELLIPDWVILPNIEILSPLALKKLILLVLLNIMLLLE